MEEATREVDTPRDDDRLEKISDKELVDVSGGWSSDETGDSTD